MPRVMTHGLNAHHRYLTPVPIRCHARVVPPCLCGRLYNFIYTQTIYRVCITNKMESTHGTTIALPHPPGATLTFASAADTAYDSNMIRGWSMFYLPDVVQMEVVGIVRGVPCPGQMVLMTCGDSHVYVYDGDGEIHLVATGGMEQLRRRGLKYPASKSYYKGEAFKDMTAADWEEVRNGPVGRRLEEEHRMLVLKHKPAMLRALKNVKKSR
ncbi:US22 protein [Pompano iridovirus]|uniref:US22 protein n=1 Tax=Pompano iridovirus TaxID=2494350 RepID=A0A3S9LMM3_ISKNV|nr:US22 protein [Pompano iridovirus]AZQ21069.1 US22 protein [Pompano iridovirus]